MVSIRDLHIILYIYIFILFINILFIDRGILSFSRFSMAEIGKNLYIAYTDDIKYVIYEIFSPVTNITRTLIRLDFVKFKFRVYKKKCPISAVTKKIYEIFSLL